MARKTYSKKRKKNLAFIIAAICLLLAAGFFFVSAGIHQKSVQNQAEESEEKSPSAAIEKKDKAQAEEKKEGPVLDPVSARADEILAGMSLEEKIDQMFLITPESLTGVGQVVQAGDATKAALEAHPVGGLVYFAQNLENADQTRQMIEQTQSFSRLGLLIAVDEEGGSVARAADQLGTTKFNPMFSYRGEGADTAQKNAAAIGADIKALGFNTDFAPVADVWSNPANTVIGERAYSDDFKEAAQLIPAAVDGFHEAGMICCLKHFPGHGDTAEDSHTSAAYTDKSYEELAAQEWSVFKAGIGAGADMVMVGHVTATRIDNVPATVSKKMITEILRGELGFEGVVITDSLQMGAVTQQYSAGELAVRAVQAGVDILLQPADFAQAESALTDAVRSGSITQERIDESVLRILKMKIQYQVVG